MSYELLDKIAGFKYCHELFLSRWLYFYQNVFISSKDQTGAPSAKLALITTSDPKGHPWTIMDDIIRVRHNLISS